LPAKGSMDRTDFAGSKKRVVILGGGFGGAYAAMALNRSLPKNWEYTLIDRNNFLLFYPLLVEAGVGSLEPRHVVVPIRDFVRDQDFRMAEITGVDLDMQQVRYRMIGALAQTSMHYDHLIIAMGSVTKMPPVRGLAEHGFQLKSLADSISLRDRAIRLLELANTVDDQEVRRALLRVVVVGANFTGIEMAGEYQDFLTDAVRSYSNIDRKDVSIVLIELSDRILAAIDADLADYARKNLETRGMDIRTSMSVKEVHEDHVVLTDGTELQSYTCIWAAGIAANPLIDRVEGLPKDRGWIKCGTDLCVQSFDNVWAIGDLAKIDDPNSKSSGATAQLAVRQGTHVARNIRKVLEHEPTVPFEYNPVGSLAALGCRTAVAKVFGIKVSGLIAWWLFRTVYLMKMPSWSRRIRIVLDWTTDLFFRRDIVQLGVPRINPSRPDLPVLEQPIDTDHFAEHRATVSDR
jgi:NADH:ubiquinone reductase (H+-translocating)